ncbi:Uncharacterised protein [Mycobacteroides abscessus subsp. abscessus]|nr:Uncharacterised protein [Mycobacteroides abscessus subsp. abscessus]
MDTSTNACQTLLGYGTKVWFQIPLAAASCQTPMNTTTESSGRAARVSRTRHCEGRGTARVPRDSSGTMSTNTDTMRRTFCD